MSSRGPPRGLSVRASTIAAAAMMLFAVFAAHYFVVIAAAMAPLFLLYYLLVLPRGASRLGAAARLAVAVMPAALFVLSSVVLPAPSYAKRALANVVTTRSENDYMLSVGGAHPTDYLTADLMLGHHDFLPLREKLTREARVEVPGIRHERTNGIRWTVIASCIALAIALCLRRFRRRFSRDERILGAFAFGLALVAFLFALSPQGIRIYDTNLGPVQLVAKLIPRFRVPNRTGILVHFAALLGAGVFAARLLRSRLARRGAAPAVVGVALVGLMVLDYPPRYGVIMAPVIAQRSDIEAAANGGACGGGITVPYVTWGFHDEDYYQVYTGLRGTSCKILHATVYTREDLALRNALGKPVYSDRDRARAEELARCAGASWVMFRLDAAPELRRSFCADMGFTFVSADVCRAPAGAKPPPLRSLRECSQDLPTDGP